MTLTQLDWLFAVGVLAHNVEEAFLLPAWSSYATGRWQAAPVESDVFRFAVAVLTALVFIAAWLASVGGPGSFGSYFITGYALAMVLNVIFPHLIATIMLRGYAPGTTTALLLNLPLGGWLVYRSLAESYVNPTVFAVSAPLIVLGLLASIPLLFAIGRRLIHYSREYEVRRKNLS